MEGKANHISFRRRNISGPGVAGGGTSCSGVDNRLLGCSYRASSVRIAIRLPTDATLYFVYLFPFLPYMFRALISPSSGVAQVVFIYNRLVHAVFMLLICVCLWTGLSWWFHCTQNKELHPLVTLLQ